MGGKDKVGVDPTEPNAALESGADLGDARTLVPAADLSKVQQGTADAAGLAGAGADDLGAPEDTEEVYEGPLAEVVFKLGLLAGEFEDVDGLVKQATFDYADARKAIVELEAEISQTEAGVANLPDTIKVVALAALEANQRVKLGEAQEKRDKALGVIHRHNDRIGRVDMGIEESALRHALLRGEQTLVEGVLDELQKELDVTVGDREEFLLKVRGLSKAAPLALLASLMDRLRHMRDSRLVSFNDNCDVDGGLGDFDTVVSESLNAFIEEAEEAFADLEDSMKTAIREELGPLVKAQAEAAEAARRAAEAAAAAEVARQAREEKIAGLKPDAEKARADLLDAVAGDLEKYEFYLGVLAERMEREADPSLADLRVNSAFGPETFGEDGLGGADVLKVPLDRSFSSVCDLFIEAFVSGEVLFKLEELAQLMTDDQISALRDKSVGSVGTYLQKVLENGVVENKKPTVFQDCIDAEMAVIEAAKCYGKGSAQLEEAFAVAMRLRKRYLHGMLSFVAKEGLGLPEKHLWLSKLLAEIRGFAIKKKDAVVEEELAQAASPEEVAEEVLRRLFGAKEWEQLVASIFGVNSNMAIPSKGPDGQKQLVQLKTAISELLGREGQEVLGEEGLKVIAGKLGEYLLPLFGNDAMARRIGELSSDVASRTGELNAVHAELRAAKEKLDAAGGREGELARENIGLKARVNKQRNVVALTAVLALIGGVAVGNIDRIVAGMSGGEMGSQSNNGAEVGVLSQVIGSTDEVASTLGESLDLNSWYSVTGEGEGYVFSPEDGVGQRSLLTLKDQAGDGARILYVQCEGGKEAARYLDGLTWDDLRPWHVTFERGVSADSVCVGGVADRVVGRVVPTGR